MTAVLTSFRGAVRDTLKTALNIDFVEGRLEGPTRRDLGCTFPDSKTKDSDFDHDLLLVMVRIFKGLGSARAPHRNPETPFDPAELETLAEAAETALSPNYRLPAIAGFWYFTVLGIEFNWDALGFEMTVQGRATSQFQEL